MRHERIEMRRFAWCLVSVTLFLPGCALLKPAPQPLPPLPVVCPRPVQLPELDQLPAQILVPSFLERLEKRMFWKPSEPRLSGSTSSTSTSSGLGLKPR